MRSNCADAVLPATILRSNLNLPQWRYVSRDLSTIFGQLILRRFGIAEHEPSSSPLSITFHQPHCNVRGAHLLLNGVTILMSQNAATKGVSTIFVASVVPMVRLPLLGLLHDVAGSICPTLRLVPRIVGVCGIETISLQGFDQGLWIARDVQGKNRSVRLNTVLLSEPIHDVKGILADCRLDIRRDLAGEHDRGVTPAGWSQ